MQLAKNTSKISKNKQKHKRTETRY